MPELPEVETMRRGLLPCLGLDSGDSLLLQPKMAGLVLVGLPPNQAHARLVIELSGVNASPIIYWDQRGLGTVRLWTANEMKNYLDSGAIGPDALAISFNDFHARFSISRREVKPTLLEQDRVAGIGNLYAAEILHRCRIHPRRRADELTKVAWRKIYEATDCAGPKEYLLLPVLPKITEHGIKS